jgi:hypothetical protein
VIVLPASVPVAVTVSGGEFPSFMTNVTLLPLMVPDIDAERVEQVLSSKTLLDVRLVPFCTMNMSAVDVCWNTFEVTVACQLPLMLLF